MRIFKVWVCTGLVLSAFVGCTNLDAVRRQSPSETPVVKYPDWFDAGRGRDGQLYYAVGQGQGLDKAQALEKAKLNGRIHISQMIQDSIFSQLGVYIEEAGFKENVEVLKTQQSLSKQIADDVVNHSVIRDTHASQNDVGSYLIYAYITIRIEIVNKELMRRIVQDQEVYTSLKASDSFKRLEGSQEAPR